MIVCSCNVLSDAKILAAFHSEGADATSSPARLYRCLGCAPRCGRCVATVRALLAKARMSHCEVSCAACPGQESEYAGEAGPPPMLIAAE